MFEYYTIAIIALLAAISPGPDFAIVAKNALTYDRRSAILSALGIGTGILIHSSYCVLGLAIVISQSLLLFSLIKYLGAAYLIYLGIKSLITKDGHLPTIAKQKASQSKWKSFRDGLFANVLNPKCTLFMLSVFTLVVKPHTPIIIQSIYGLEIAFITTAWFFFLAYGLSSKIVKSKIEKLQHIVSKLIGGVLILFGLGVLFETR